MLSVERLQAENAAMEADLVAFTAMLRRQRERALADDEEDLRTERNPYLRRMLEESIAQLKADLARMDLEEAAAKR